ncbi:death domain-containing protein CRADD isoform X2 [Ictalurus punctatus]|uniref:Death domain-containing protein CRADD isoform X2 n=1 Tax=Ictalurus punctatus TaxID=7998 RepID=A0A9F7RG89_ICTPU|nr:death domain-containing protein CRADD isoform X2 [Ictalurus punctatus]
MEPKHRDLLRAQRLHLCEQLVVDETIVQYLYQEDILTEGQVEEIQSQKSNKNKTLLLLSILPNRGPNAFNVFVQSLEQDFPWIKEKLLLLADEDEQDGGRGTELSNTTDGCFNLDILNTLPPPQTSGESTIIKTKKPRTSESLQSKRERTEPVLRE